MCSAVANDTTSVITCKTEKDRHVRLHERTAGTQKCTQHDLNCVLDTCTVGVLAGMRPCGMIVLLNELFTAESKTQVYGSLHNFYRMHPAIAHKIGKSSTNCWNLIFFQILYRIYLL